MSVLTFVGKLINEIGSFFSKLWHDTEDAFKLLPPQQQDAIIQGVNISQIMKEGYTKGADFVVTEVATKLNVSKDVATGVILFALKSLRINVTDIQAGFDKLADQIQAGITDEGWNGLWQLVAQAAASFMGTGSINWITLGMGVIELIVQKLKAGVL